jgi:hypothetical protein
VACFAQDDNFAVGWQCTIPCLQNRETRGTLCVAGVSEGQPQILRSAEKRFAQDDTSVI